jgi:Fe-S oxidoreductase
MCSGLGACRKTLAGTMCPSYMATREETHSTRGRSNVLRLAMNGQLGSAGLGEEGIREVLDLCLECRACKTECPVGVDVGRFKSEFLASLWERRSPPPGVRLIGHARRLARAGSLTAPLSNALARSAPVRWLNERYLGIDRRRRLPVWTWRTFEHRFHEREEASTDDAPDLYLFNDTWTNYVSPEIGLASVALIERAGVRVALSANRCCGRPLISQGLLSEARQLALENTRLLYPEAERGLPLLFCEPSCLSAVVEDAPDLLRGEDARRARAVAGQAMLVEEYLSARLESGQIDLRFRPGLDRIVVHGHCHQKAMGRLDATTRLLGRIEGCTIEALDAGCCGMAGSFGYMKNHYEVSRAIGERRLLPRARALREGERLVASGTSCRHQVAELAGVPAVHPIQLLAEEVLP